MATVRDDRSLGELFSELAHESSTLVRQEIALARTELSQKAALAARGVGFVAVGGVLAYAGLLAVMAAIIVALGAVGIPLWLSALLVGIVFAATGYAFIRKGLGALKSRGLQPRQTMESLREDARWAKEQFR